MKKVLKRILICIAFGCILGAFACSNKNTVSVTVEQLIQANDRKKVIDEYDNLHITRTDIYSTGSIYKLNEYFYSNDYGMVADLLYENTNGYGYYSDTLINGIRLSKDVISPDEYWYVGMLFDDSSYSDYINSLDNLDKREIIKGPEIVDGKIVVETESKGEKPLSLEKKTFYINTQTLLIERTMAEYTINYSDGTLEEGTGEAIYEYSCSDFKPKMNAYNEHKNVEDKASFIIVRNAGTENEKRTLYTIATESMLSIFGTHEIYFDKECTIKVEDFRDYLKEGYVPVFYLS